MSEIEKQKIAGIVLAAGASRRMGTPKLLLPWQGKPIVQHVVQTALEAGLAPVLVVAGEHESEIFAALRGLDVSFVSNPDWSAGQSTSITIGVRALQNIEDDSLRAAIFLLGDQPRVPAALVHAIIAAYERTGEKIIAPSVHGKRANPVLFDRSLFPALLELCGDAGARQLFNSHPPFLVAWEDERILLDVDTPADYQQLLSNS